VEPGSYDLAELVTVCDSSPWPVPIALDLWNDSVGFPLPPALHIPADWVWRSRLPLSDAAQHEVEKQISVFLNAIHFLSTRLPACLQWVLSTTQVVLPLRSESERGFRSGSNPGLPGLVCIDLNVRDIEILEALVHESAHHHFHVAAVQAPLVEPSYEGLHRSPLRQDPRPLKGIFLAYHALVFMRLLYTECRNLGIANLDQEIVRLQQLADDAGETLNCHQQHLTPSGLNFFEITKKVGCYVE
jgi:HEXXH motif-containing protein